jgi:type IV fimbrial biogenesis protein FimT
MRRKERGFNIIELLVTLVVVGVVVTMGAPSLVDFTNDMRLTATTNDLLTFFNYARSEAARRGTRVTICISADQATCATAGTDWAVGAMAFIDSDNNGQFTAGETVLRVMNPISGVKVNATAAFATNYYFYYRPTGLTNSAGTLRVCRIGRLARDISVNSIGRPISQTTTAVCT